MRPDLEIPRLPAPKGNPNVPQGRRGHSPREPWRQAARGAGWYQERLPLSPLEEIRPVPAGGKGRTGDLPG